MWRRRSSSMNDDEPDKAEVAGFGLVPLFIFGVTNSLVFVS